MNADYRCFILIFLVFLPVEFSFAQNSIQQRFDPPPGFERIDLSKESFGTWLRQLPVQEKNSPVLDFRGNIFKQATDSSVAAVLEMDIRGHRLQQCMDILLRFYSTFLIQNGLRDSISFPLPDGLELSWQNWQAGWRPQFKGLHFKLFKSESADNSLKNFRSFLNEIFSYSGSHTFYHYYPQVELADIQPGDFVVRKNRKGHAVLIVDMAVNDQGRKMVMVGQGDTPACQFYILKGKNGSPWFEVEQAINFPDLPIKKKMFWTGLRRFPAYAD